jgi:acetyl esterase/lipase
MNQTTTAPEKKPSVRAVARNLWNLWTPNRTAVVEPTHADVVYRTAATRRPLTIAPRCDIYLPEADMAHGRSVVLVHGGGFVIGSKGMKPMRLLSTNLTAAGYGVCVIDYRMAFRGGRLPEGVSDVVHAMQFWQGRSAEFGFDPDQIALVGLSAGATLSMMAMAQPETDGLVTRVGSIFGLYDLELLKGALAGTISTLSVRSRKAEVQRAHSPINSPQTERPVLLMHGGVDALVPVEQARRMNAHRESLGLPTELVIYEGQPHGFFCTQTPESETATRDLLAFLDKTRG